MARRARRKKGESLGSFNSKFKSKSAISTRSTQRGGRTISKPTTRTAGSRDCNSGEVELWGECYPIDMSQSPYNGVLNLWNSGLTGEIPPEIGQLMNLTVLRLDNNLLTGSIPPEIGNLTDLTKLYLYNNQLTGEIPPEIGNITNLDNLRLMYNQLSGEIPEEIGNLTNLTYLYLYINQLTGVIPESICNVGSSLQLNVMHLWNNQLCPPYPDCLDEDDNCQSGFGLCLGSQDTSECGEPLSDIDTNWQVDVNDVINLINIILDAGIDGGIPYGDPAYIESYDLNNDGNIDVADVVTLVHIVLADPQTTSAEQRQLEYQLSRLDGLQRTPKPTRSTQRGRRTSTRRSGDRSCEPWYIGDGTCDSSCNTIYYNWDGGDCCPGDCYNPCDANNRYMESLGMPGPCNCGRQTEQPISCVGTYGCDPSNQDLNPCCCDGVSVSNCNECPTADCNHEETIYNYCYDVYQNPGCIDDDAYLQLMGNPEITCEVVVEWFADWDGCDTFWGDTTNTIYDICPVSCGLCEDGGEPGAVGDGICDSDYNTIYYNWDDGDCCPGNCYDPCDVNNMYMDSIGVPGACICGYCPGTYGYEPFNPDLNPCCCDGVSVENISQCEGANACDLPGDINGDGVLNVLDIVELINLVLLGGGEINPCSDLNGDGVTNVLDVVTLVYIIVNSSTDTRSSTTSGERKMLTNILRDLQNVQNKSNNEQMLVLQNIKSKLQRTSKPIRRTNKSKMRKRGPNYRRGKRKKR